MTSKGAVDMMAEAVVEGTKLTLKEIAVYPRDAEFLELGTKEVLKLLRGQLARKAKELGFETLRIQGKRYSGANPGKYVDFEIDLMNMEW